ncbi:MAG: phospholipase D-like domain-containing protein, partial [Ezakiella massiliensis]
FIPDDSVLEGLRVASLSGVDIRVMLPYKGDHPFIYWANLSYVGDLLKAGVKFYFYEKGFQHSKVMIIDDEILTVGTSNMDERSFHLNFEVNAFVYDKETALEFSNKFLADIEENSSEITKEIYDKRSKLVRFKENFSRLLSPLL